MNIICKLGIVLFVVLGATNKAFCQKKREKIDFIEIEEKQISRFKYSIQTDIDSIFFQYLWIPIRGLGCVTISTCVEKGFQDVFFLQYEGLNELRQNYNFPGYYKDTINN